MTAEASVEQEPHAKEADAGAREAGRGGLAIAAAKISFVLVGLVQQIVFPRVLDDAGYGAVSRILGVVSILNNVIVATSLQGVSRTVAAARGGTQEQAFRTVLQIHVVIALVASVSFALLAGQIASWIEAPEAATPLRIAAAVVLCYGVYAPLVGSLNGRRRFLDQAGLDIFYGISRTAAMVLGAFLFARLLGADGVLGAIIGFATAAAVIVPVALWRSGIGKPGSGVPTLKEYLSFLLPVFVAQGGLNLLLQADLLLLSSAAGEYARTMNLSPKEADKLLGPYRASQLFGFLPYQLLMSVQFVLFPLLSKASAEGDKEAVRNLTRSGVRTALILAGLIGGSIASIAPQLMRLVFPEPIAEQAVPFVRFYALGLVTLSILGVSSSALASLRRERWSVGLTWLGVVLVVGSVLMLRPQSGWGATLLMWTAYSTAGAIAVASVVGAIMLWRAAGGFVNPLSLLRVAAAVAVTFGVGVMLPYKGKVLVPAYGVVVALTYVFVLIATRELTGADLALLKKVVGRKRLS